LHRGESYEKLGFAELAISDYKRFKCLQPDYIEKLHQLYFEKQGTNKSGEKL